MRTILFATTLLLLPFALGATSATTNACAQQTTVGVYACGNLGTFQGGDGSCQTTGSYSGGAGWVGVGAGGSQRGVAFDNGCYAYAYDGHPYEGSQVAVHAWENGPDGYNDQGAYLNSGVFHGEGGDHEYCYVTQLDENGEDQDGLRVDCPTHVQVPVLLGWLP